VLQSCDPEPLLANDFRRHLGEAERRPRLGQATSWAEGWLRIPEAGEVFRNSSFQADQIYHLAT